MEVNEGTTVWYFAAVACRGSSSSSNTGLAAVVCPGSSSSSSSSNDLAAVVFFISIDVASLLFPRPGRHNSSNRHGESLRSELVGSTTAGAIPYTSRRTHLPRRHRCVRCTAVAVAANMGTSPNNVLHRVSLRTLAASAASMVTYGGIALSLAVGNLIWTSSPLPASVPSLMHTEQTP